MSVVRILHAFVIKAPHAAQRSANTIFCSLMSGRFQLIFLFFLKSSQKFCLAIGWVLSAFLKHQPNARAAPSSSTYIKEPHQWLLSVLLIHLLKQGLLGTSPAECGGSISANWAEPSNLSVAASDSILRGQPFPQELQRRRRKETSKPRLSDWLQFSSGFLEVPSGRKVTLLFYAISSTISFPGDILGQWITSFE